MFDLTDKIIIKIDNTWFDVTNYNNHPGGKQISRLVRKN